jgi:hypothetical protein
MNNALFWARYIYDVVVPEFEVFRSLVTGRVLQAFSGLEEEADKVAQEAWERYTSKPSLSEEDLSRLAEDAQEAGVDYYVTAHRVRQGTVNAMTVALYHLHEQQLLYIHRRELLHPREENDIRLLNMDEIKKRLSAYGLDLDGLGSPSILKELQLVANVVKHGDGHSSRKLKGLRPELFVSPSLGSHRAAFPPRSQVVRPLIGEDLYVSDDELVAYFAEVENFWKAFAQSLAAMSKVQKHQPTEF